MGRRLLLIALAAAGFLLAGCNGEEDSGHAELPCARCHDGAVTARTDEQTARTVAAATSDACTSCHDERTADVHFGAVELPHRDHGADSAMAMGCAACHTHESGRDSLRVTTTGCALCHAESLDGSNPTACRDCHVDPGHTAFASQGVPVMHASLPWIGGECIRCHFDVGQPRTAVPSNSCADCHRDPDAAAEAGAGLDLHPSHTAVSCASCHEDVEHHIGAMSSSVVLQCAQCHTRPHEVSADDPLARDIASCNDCHADEHAAEQGMVLGVAPAGVQARPADKFLVGLTCRSCHVAGGPDAPATRVSCTTCHPAEYARVLAWWKQGTAERVADTRRFVSDATATAARSGSEAARAEAAAADSLLRFVEAGGAAHNLPLSFDVLGAALARAQEAIRAGGGGTPAAPQLGRRPRMGQCTYCHYQWREPRFEIDMPDAFHREVMERGRAAARMLD